MNDFIAALPMYDWPECRAETDAEWSGLRDALRAKGIRAPDALTRGDDLQSLWRDPRLLLGQTCWGPMEAGLREHVQVIGQPDYSAFEGGEGPFYSSVILMRCDGGGSAVDAPAEGTAHIPLDRLHSRIFAFNEPVSMSGLLALTRDIEALGGSLGVFSERIQTGGHRASLVAVANGRADVCAVDCRSWALAQRFEPAAARLKPVGWTARRPGLPYITAVETGADLVVALQEVLATHASVHLPDRMAAPD